MEGHKHGRPRMMISLLQCILKAISQYIEGLPSSSPPRLRRTMNQRIGHIHRVQQKGQLLTQKLKLSMQLICSRQSPGLMLVRCADAQCRLHTRHPHRI